MNKSLIVIALAALQCACATQDAVPQTSNSLLSFTEIAAEITVGFENFDGSAVADQALVQSLADSP